MGPMNEGYKRQKTLSIRKGLTGDKIVCGKNATLYIIIICSCYASMEPVGEKDYEEYIIKLAPATHAVLIEPCVYGTHE